MGGLFDSFGRLGYRFRTDKRNFGSPRYVFEVQFGRPVAISGRNIHRTSAKRKPKYVNEVLRTVILPYVNAHNEWAAFQHDNAHPNTVRVTTAFLCAKQHQCDGLAIPDRRTDGKADAYIAHCYKQVRQKKYYRIIINTLLQVLRPTESYWFCIYLTKSCDGINEDLPAPLSSYSSR